MSQDRFEELSPDRLVAFAAGLANLPKEEMEKAKVLYLRNAIANYEEMLKSYAAFAFLQVFFSAIPCFFPFLVAQWFAMHAAKKAAQQKVADALDVWRDDLGEEYRNLKSRLVNPLLQTWLAIAPIIGLIMFAIVIAWMYQDGVFSDD